jgi:predicted nucleic acid-binding protein
MKLRFVDAHYLLALVNSDDEHHVAAVKWTEGKSGRLLTTSWVLVEFADALSAPAWRLHAVNFLRVFQARPTVEVVAPTQQQFERALELYEQRPDKHWSLTDCISFRVMEERGILEALTNDRHFEQAGFLALLREES